MRQPVILFDIDGTLILSGGAATAAFDAAFYDIYKIENASANVVKSGRTDYSITQEVARLALKRELSLDELNYLYSKYLPNLSSELNRTKSFRILPGVSSLLEALKQLNIPLGIQTGNIESAATAKLSKAAIHGYFTFGGYCQNQEGRESVVSAALNQINERQLRNEDIQIFLVGDTPSDIKAAKAFDLTPIGVCTGKYNYQALSESGAEIVFDDLADNKRFIDCINR